MHYLRRTKRAIRRAHYYRTKTKRKSYSWVRQNNSEEYDYYHEFRNNIAINTPKPCSCFMCGNPRKYWNKETKSEYINKWNEAEGREEANESFIIPRKNYTQH